MGAHDLLVAIRAAGLSPTVVDGRLRVTGPTNALDQFRPAIREYRDRLVLELNGATTVAGEHAASHTSLIHNPDREPLEVACCPEATHAEILERHPDAVAAEPFTPTIRQPSARLTAEEETAILAWLATIGETDQATIAEVIGQCQRDADARDYFTGRAAADNLQKNEGNAAFDDGRRTCAQCANLIARRCQAAQRGEIVASRNYEPIRDQLRRCEGYAPGPDDPDRRPGRERWPALIQKGSG